MACNRCQSTGRRRVGIDDRCARARHGSGWQRPLSRLRYHLALSPRASGGDVRDHSTCRRKSERSGRYRDRASASRVLSANRDCLGSSCHLLDTRPSPPPTSVARMVAGGVRPCRRGSRVDPASQCGTRHAHRGWKVPSVGFGLAGPNPGPRRLVEVSVTP
jgi:hypothetical protein